MRLDLKAGNKRGRGALPSLALEEECLIQETGEKESVNNLKEKVFELENSIVKLNIDHEKMYW